MFPKRERRSRLAAINLRVHIRSISLLYMPCDTNKMNAPAGSKSANFEHDAPRLASWITALVTKQMASPGSLTQKTGD